jgi:hypothetical protein
MNSLHFFQAKNFEPIWGLKRRRSSIYEPSAEALTTPFAAAKQEVGERFVTSGSEAPETVDEDDEPLAKRCRSYCDVKVEAAAGDVQSDTLAEEERPDEKTGESECFFLHTGISETSFFVFSLYLSHFHPKDMEVQITKKVCNNMLNYWLTANC